MEAGFMGTVQKTRGAKRGRVVGALEISLGGGGYEGP